MSLRFGVVGYPVAHSLSPVIHKAAFQAAGIDADYERFEVEPEKLGVFIQKVRQENIRGLSVTMPHKEKIMAFLDEIDVQAQRIGAVNTVLNENGRLKGFNTDGEGARLALEERILLKRRKALIIGAGGASAAIVFACREAGVDVTILNRTHQKAIELAERFGGKAGILADVLDYPADIVIQTTSVGLFSSPDLSLIPPAYFKKFALNKVHRGSENSFQGPLAMDIIYNPLKTRFLKEAEANNWQIISGDVMFLYQAEKQFEIWFEQKTDINIMKKEFLKELRKL